MHQFTDYQLKNDPEVVSSEIYVLKIRKCKTWANCMKKECPVRLLQNRNILMDCILNQKMCQMKYETYCKSIMILHVTDR